jgi:hypothetical protein
MASVNLGTVRSGKGRKFGVKWDEKTRHVYVVDFNVWFSSAVKRCPTKASSARDAMRVAEAYLYNK